MKTSIKSFILDYMEEGDPIPEDDLTIASVKVGV